MRALEPHLGLVRCLRAGDSGCVLDGGCGLALYEAARRDPILGPVFESRVQDWDLHLERMTQFWGSVLGGEGSFRPREEGGPVLLHRRMAELEMAHFRRWLDLFDRTCDATFPAAVAEYAGRRARSMGAALSAHLAG